MNIEIFNSIHGGVVLSINNYLYIKNKDYNIRKIDNKHIFYWTCVKQCGAKIRTFCENNVHYIDKNVLNDMFPLATHSACFFPFITKHFQKTSKSWSLFNVF